MQGDASRETGADEGQPVALTAERLAAVRLLLDAERVPETHDILLASVFEYLESGPKSVHEVLAYVRRVWPGVAIDLNTLAATLNEAEVRGFTRHEQVDFGGSVRWALGAGGELDLKRSRDWADDTLRRFTSDLAAEARAVGIVTVPERLQLLADLLLDTIAAVIADAFAIEPTFEVIGGRHIFPASYDLAKADSLIERRSIDEAVAQFLSLMVRVALDPSQPFGTELVHTLATGYVLSAFVGRLDSPRARAVVGSLAGEVAILDTPILLRLIGSTVSRMPFMDTVARARAAGYRIVVHQRTFEELDVALKSRVTSGVVTLIENTLNEGVDRESLRRLTGDGVVSTWLEADPPEPNTYLPWASFRANALNLEPTLRSIGVEVVPPIYLDVADSDRHIRFATHLKDRLRSRRTTRGVSNIEHDAAMLVTAYHLRSTNPPNEAKLWPGGFVITPDTYLNATYRDVVGQEEFPVAVTLGQWAGILAAGSPPVAAEQLARIISTETSMQSLLMRAVGFPIEASIELAKSLKDQDVGLADIQSVQLSLDEVLAEQPDVSSAQGEDARRVAHRVLERKMRRTDAAFAYQTKEREAETARIERRSLDKIKEAELRARVAEADAITKDEKLNDLEDRLGELESQLADHDAKDDQRRLRNRRLVPHLVASSLLAVSALVLSVLYMTDEPVSGSLVISSWVIFLVFGAASIEVVYDLERPWWLAVTSLLVGPAGWLLLELVLT